MSKRTVEIVIDDIDGKELKEGEGQTVTFAIGRSQYELDLSEKNAEKFYDTLKPYTDVARKIGSSRIGSQPVGAGTGRGAARTDKEQLQAIRDWARKQGIEVSDRGRIGKQVRDAYDAAN